MYKKNDSLAITIMARKSGREWDCLKVADKMIESTRKIKKEVVQKNRILCKEQSGQKDWKPDRFANEKDENIIDFNELWGAVIQ